MGGGRFIYLKCPPIVSISAISYSDIWDWASATVLSSSDYSFDPIAGMVQYGGFVWPVGPMGVKVVYTGGYSVPPLDLDAAVASQVAYNFNRRRDLGLESIILPDGTTQKQSTNEFIQSAKSVFDRYKLKRIG